MERADKGSVTVGGSELTGMSEDQLARFRGGSVGIVFQSFHLIPNMTALENVAVPLELAGVPRAFDAAREELAAVGLAERTSHYPSQMSGGEQQRVAIARALAGSPRVLLADEPTGNLDSQMARGVMELLEEINAAGTTILMVTHDPELAARAHRNVHIIDGQVSDLTHETARSLANAAAAHATTA
ncbi:MAG: ABC transporter ATP-binding protein [Arenimonas sp.]|nr:ABC transporter ATP-binding protein [Arenimonas sp.]